MKIVRRVNAVNEYPSSFVSQEFTGQEALRKLQEISYDLLKEFNRACPKHGIPFFGAWGMLLGTARHKGSIPWDEDADIWFPDQESSGAFVAVSHEMGDFYELRVSGDDGSYFRDFIPRIVRRDALFKSNKEENEYFFQTYERKLVHALGVPLKWIRSS